MTVAPTDVTEPPTGWTWAAKEAHSWKPESGVMRWVVTQTTPAEKRTSGPHESAATLELMKQWNDEAKAGA